MDPERLLGRLPPPPPGRTGWPWTVETAPPADAAAVAWPRISIVMPSYQQAAYLEEGLRSVLLQNYPTLEFIVNDGDSKDDSAAILSRYAPFLTHWQSAPDGGQGHAINQGFERATGEILGWLNSDDFYLPGALFTVAREFLRGSPDIVYGDACNFFEEDRTLSYWQAFWIRPAFLKMGGLLSSHATFWRRSAHQPLWAELNCNVDGELWQRLIPGRQLRYLPLPLGVLRVHAETKSAGERWKEKWRQDDEKIWARHGPPSYGRIYRRVFNRGQRLIKWFTWRQQRPAKRAVIEACHWPSLKWRGPSP